MDARLTPGVKWLLIANTVAFLPGLVAPISQSYAHLFALRPEWAVGHLFVWQFLTYAFLHTGPLHYAFNMLALYMFGTDVESSMGTRKFLWLYFLSAVGAGLLSAPLFWGKSIVGASGAILALLYVFARTNPHRTILLFFVIPVPAIAAVWFIGALSLAFALSGSGGNVAHLTHLAGLLVGWAFWRYQGWAQRLLESRKKRTLEREWRERLVFANRKREFYAREIDPILEKISRQGLHSLTAAEKEKLKKAKQMREEGKWP